MQNIVILFSIGAIVMVLLIIWFWYLPYIEKIKIGLQGKNKRNGDKIVTVSGSENVSIYQLEEYFNYPKGLIKDINQWRKIDKTFSDKYFLNEKIEKFISSIREPILSEERVTIRVLGLAGLGKTRLVYECFNKFEKFQGDLFYSDAAYQEQDILRYLNQVHEKKSTKSSVFIVDNCNLNLHSRLIREINQLGGEINLITIDFSVGEKISLNQQTSIIELQSNYFEGDILPNMIRHYYPKLPDSDVDKITRFAQGFPLIATQLAEARALGSENIGELSDDVLMRRLIGFDKQNDEKSYHVLKACSIFSKLGFYNDLNKNKNFVATNSSISRLTGSNEDKITIFENKCNQFLKRGILEKRGRFIIVRPQPLAIRLAADWWRECVINGNAINLIQEITNEGLGNDLCEQIAKLDFLPEAQELTEELCGPHAPFGKAEVLNTDEGSRLFRSFSEVNPHVTTNTLYHHYAEASLDSLLKVEKGRRYLVWTLEKLCFRKDTFDKASKVLLNFAAAENENISNNAEGQFIQLYQLVLPGTSANLEQRFKILEYGLKKNNPKYTSIVLFAIQRSFASTRSSHRMMGAENFGSSPTMEDYYPSREEVEEYYRKLFILLKPLILNENEFSKQSKDIIGISIGTIYQNGFGDLIFKVINEIINNQPQFWREAYSSIINLNVYEKKHQSKKAIDNIDNLLVLLEPKDFVSIYEIIIGNPIRWNIYLKKSWEEFRKEGLSYRDISEKHIELFIKNESEKIMNSDFILYYTNPQQEGFLFGSRVCNEIYTNSEKFNFFIDKSISAILTIKLEKLNISVLAGFIHQIPNNQVQLKILERLIDTGVSPSHFIEVARFSKPRLTLLKYWVDTLIKKSRIEIFRVFAYGKALSHLDIKEIINFCEYIGLNFDTAGTHVALDILSSYFDTGDTTWEKGEPLIKKLISQKGVISQLDSTDSTWKLYIRTFINKLLEKSDDLFVHRLKEEVFFSISQNEGYGTHNEIENILSILIKDYFNLIWDDLGKKILTDSKFYFLARFNLGVKESFRYSEGLLFKDSANFPIILEWCKNNAPEAPRLIASIMPTASNDNEGKLVWHPFAKQLLDYFGDDKDLLNRLGANLNSYGTVGSSVPYLESKKTILEQLRNHPIKSVREFAISSIKELQNSINNATIRDEEWDIR